MNTSDNGTNGEATEKLLSEYERAQEVAQHSDGVFWEITSIIWGANTLMLGFVLEAVGNSQARLLILFTGMLGMVISEVPIATYHSGKIGQRIGFEACRDIEAKLQLHSQLHTRIDAKYPKHFIKWVVYLISLFFVAAWTMVGFVDFGWCGAIGVFTVAPASGTLLYWLWKRGLRR